MWRTRMTTLAFILSELFLLDFSDAISFPPHNLNTLVFISPVPPPPPPPQKKKKKKKYLFFLDLDSL